MDIPFLDFVIPALVGAIFSAIGLAYWHKMREETDQPKREQAVIDSANAPWTALLSQQVTDVRRFNDVMRAHLNSVNTESEAGAISVMTHLSQAHQACAALIDLARQSVDQTAVLIEQSNQKIQEQASMIESLNAMSMSHDERNNRQSQWLDGLTV